MENERVLNPDLEHDEFMRQAVALRITWEMKLQNVREKIEALDKEIKEYETKGRAGDGVVDWVKKLGQWHLSDGNGKTFCGVPMLGNNYARDIPESERVKCDRCFHFLYLSPRNLTHYLDN